MYVQSWVPSSCHWGAIPKSKPQAKHHDHKHHSHVDDDDPVVLSFDANRERREGNRELGRRRSEEICNFEIDRVFGGADLEQVINVAVVGTIATVCRDYSKSTGWDIE